MTKNFFQNVNGSNERNNDKEKHTPENIHKQSTKNSRF